LACYNVDTREQILIFFGRNTICTNKVGNQKTFYTMPSQITFVSALPSKTGNTNITFFTRCISALREFNQLLLHFFNLLDSQLIFTLLYDSLNLVINVFSYGSFGGHGSGERKSRALQQLDCIACTKYQCAVFWVFSFAR